MKYDIVIIGGGVIGSAIARELGRFALKTVLLEKEDDIAMGTSKANSGIIHAGYNAASSTLKGKLNVEANPLFDDLSAKLKFPFKRTGSLVVGFNKEDLQVLLKEKENGDKLGVKNLQLIEEGKLLEMEPNLNPDAKYALYAPTAGIISPYEYAIALADNAVINGVEVLLETEVKGILTEGKEIRGVKTNRAVIEAKIVINAAGLFSDRIAYLAGDDCFSIKARKGEYHLLDKNRGDYLK
ncbi:MAG TPA: FAD-dependent oxidoreductase, partial [Halanaerobiales bacterium]|nr:FAD-dependent oxidoreductase [Halanaerobiales bacterium]